MAQAGVYLPGFLPKEELDGVIHAFPHVEVMFAQQIPNDELLSHAAKAVEEGCDLFIARGLQAEILQENLPGVPVLSLRLSVQEIGCIVLKILSDLKRKRRLKIRLIGYANMYSDVSHLSEFFPADISVTLLRQKDSMKDVLIDAVNAGTDAVIGGRHCCEAAASLGLPAYFAALGSESIRQTLAGAETLCELIDTRRLDTAEAQAIVANNFNGILQVDSAGVCVGANRMMQQFLNKTPEEIKGRPVTSVLPGFDAQTLTDAFRGGKEIYSYMYRYDSTVYAVNLTPIVVQGRAHGACLTFQEGQTIRQLSSDIRREIVKRGFVAKASFKDLDLIRSESMKNVIRTAKMAAGLATPVLITAPGGCESDRLAMAIHSLSPASANPFVMVPCAAYDAEQLEHLLFEESEDPDARGLSYIEAASEGTLYLRDVDRLSPAAQNRLMTFLQDGIFKDSEGRVHESTCRIMASSGKDLAQEAAKGNFSASLYYCLSVIRLDIPPIRKRREDILPYVDEFMAKYSKEYHRLVRLTQGARKALEEYDWPGNVTQIQQTVQKILIFCGHRDASELFVRGQLEPVYEAVREEGQTRIVTYQDKKAAEIRNLLAKYQGSRAKVAEEMGISTTTLWRYMKKYGISAENDKNE